MISLLNDIADFFLPRICPACDNKLAPGETAVCAGCFDKIQIADEYRLASEFRRKFKDNNIISGFTSLYVFEKDKELQHIIHSLKYRKRFHNGLFLGRVLGIHLQDMLGEWKIDLVVPVPLHSVKKAERGFNQSFYIAKGLSKAVNIPFDEAVIKRIKYTQSQTTLTIEERAENMRNAFKVIKRERVQEKHILLIDDVITTGATTTECGRVLLEAGALKIFAVSVAIAD